MHRLGISRKIAKIKDRKSMAELKLDLGEPC